MTTEPSNSSQAPSPIALSGTEPFAVGGRRRCYAHPLELNKCIKILRTDSKRTVRMAKSKGLIPRQWRREYNNNAHEQKILESLEHQIGSDLDQHLPRSYGNVETDLGPGLVLTLVRDHDQKISRSIRELITAGMDVDLLRPAFDQFSEFLLHHRVLTRTILDHNIVAQDHGDGSWQLFIIDGLGDPAWLPAARWIKSVARRKISKRLAAAWTRFHSFAATGGVSEELRKNSTWDQGILRHRG